MDQKERATADALADPDGFRHYLRLHPSTRARRMERPFTVETPNGTVDGNPGDYLALDPLGKPYPISADVFADTFHAEPQGGA